MAKALGARLIARLVSASATRGMLSVLVSAMGVSKAPVSRSWSNPAYLPKPLITATPAATLSS